MEARINLLTLLCSDRIYSYHSSYGSRSSSSFTWNTSGIESCHGDRITREAQRQLRSGLNLDRQQLVLALLVSEEVPDSMF